MFPCFLFLQRTSPFCLRFRANLKKNPDLWNDYKKKESERKRYERLNRTEEKKTKRQRTIKGAATPLQAALKRKWSSTETKH